MSQTTTLDDVIDLLNELLAIDPRAITQLVETRVPCSSLLLGHPSVQVVDMEDGTGPHVGVLGVLNGFFGADSDGWGRITAVYDTQNGRGRIVAFRPTSQQSRTITT